MQIVRQMNASYENRWSVDPRSNIETSDSCLANFAIKQIKFNHHNQQQLKFTHMKNALPVSIVQNRKNKLLNKNSKLLPGLKFRLAASAKIQSQQKNNIFQSRNSGKQKITLKNSQILNSLIQILKSDPDKQHQYQSRNGRIKTLPPSCLNEFIENREISSVRNSRMPKIVNNEIMQSSQKTKRSLVSEEKSRNKLQYGEQLNYYTANKSTMRKPDAFDEMQMTFYKPLKMHTEQKQKNMNYLKKLQQNEFITN